MSGDDDELRRRQREEEAARDRAWDSHEEISISHHPCAVCGEDHREDHRGSDGVWVDFPDHDLVAKLLVP